MFLVKKSHFMIVFLFTALLILLLSACTKTFLGVESSCQVQFDAYEEKPTSAKSNNVLLLRKHSQLSHLTLWFPTPMRKDVDIDNIFTDTRVPPSPQDTSMRINVYTHDGTAYVSLLTQPILVGAQLMAGYAHNVSAYIKPNYAIPKNSVLVVQREYFQETDFPNLVSIQLDQC